MDEIAGQLINIFISIYEFAEVIFIYLLLAIFCDWRKIEDKLDEARDNVEYWKKGRSYE